MKLIEYNKLNEGVKFFKNSEKLKKLASQIEYNVLTKISNDEQRKEIREYVSTVHQAIKDFEIIEKEYSIGNKKNARFLFKEAKQKYSYLLARVEKPILSLFKQYGSSLLYFATIQAFSFLVAPKLTALFKKQT